MNTDDQYRVTVDELREICALTAKLTELRQNECKHLCIENIGPEIMRNLLKELRDHKCGNPCCETSIQYEGEMNNQVIFTVIDNQNGHKYEIFANGSVAGFGIDRIILNNIPSTIYRAIENEREECARICEDFANNAAGTESGSCAIYLAQKIRRAQ